MFILIQECSHLSLVFGSSRPVGSCFILLVSNALLQAGLLCGVSDFNTYVWEEQVSVLGLESFYFGKKKHKGLNIS